MKLLVYEHEHLEKLIPEMRRFEAKDIAIAPRGVESLREWAMQMKQVALMMTMMTDDGRVAAIFAGLKVNETTMKIWAFTGQAIDDHKKEFWQASRRALGILVEEEREITRIQAVVEESHDASRAWLTRLGFVNETPYGMKNYGPRDETFFLFALRLPRR